MTRKTAGAWESYLACRRRKLWMEKVLYPSSPSLFPSMYGTLLYYFSFFFLWCIIYSRPQVSFFPLVLLVWDSIEIWIPKVLIICIRDYITISAQQQCCPEFKSLNLLIHTRTIIYTRMDKSYTAMGTRHIRVETIALARYIYEKDEPNHFY